MTANCELRLWSWLLLLLLVGLFSLARKNINRSLLIIQTAEKQPMKSYVVLCALSLLIWHGGANVAQNANHSHKFHLRNSVRTVHRILKASKGISAKHYYKLTINFISIQHIDVHEWMVGHGCGIRLLFIFVFFLSNSVHLLLHTALRFRKFIFGNPSRQPHTINNHGSD